MNATSKNWSPTEQLLSEHLQKLDADGLPDYIKKSFGLYFRKLCADETGVMRETDIRPVDPAALKAFDDLGVFADRGRAELQRCSIAKLNGGLGTSMGLQRAKSLLVVQQGLSFLDIIARQVTYFRETSQVSLPLLFMNSFNTEQDTLDALAGFGGNPEGIPLSFLQHRFPKVLAESGEPADWQANQQLTWNPPGHGEFYSALDYSGTLQALLENGIEYLFISNSDNLGATLSLEILGYMAANEIPFIMEVAERTPNDRKGGHLAFTADGRLTLRESAQCDDADVDAFQDITRHRFFNTNTLWVSLSALEQQLADASDHVLELPMIRNEKRLDPTDDKSPKVYQLESAMGAAISLFDGAQAVVVPRSRFLPVKKTNDLLLVRSDCYALNDDFSVSEQRPADAGACVVDLDPGYYGTIAKFDQRFPAGVPSLINCDSLTVEGDVTFGRDVRCVGNVHIRNASDAPATIEDNITIDGSISF